MSDEFIEGLEFALKFAPAVIKLRVAELRGESLTLNHEEVCVLIEALRILKTGPDESRT